MTLLFGQPAPRVLNVPPSARFLDVLASGLIASTDAYNDPLALADAVVFLPNRRSARALVAALREQLGAEALIAPLIRTLGDLGEAEEDAAFADPDALQLPPAIDPAERLAELARLVLAFHRQTGRPASLTACLSGAEALAHVLDQAALEGGADWSALSDFAPEADLAEHWNEAARFLQIATDAWPRHLASLGVVDPMERRELTIRKLAQRWAEDPPSHPVVLAGSTGAQPSVRALMKTIAGLPKGCVVLPGLDASLDESALAALHSSPSHPQSALVRACEALDVKPWQVPTWPGLTETGEQRARRSFVSEALAPAQLTADWLSRLARLANGYPGGTVAFGRAALNRFELAEAADETEEALAAALALREALEVPGRTAALVTPDAGLARRVAAVLERWGIDCPPSEGAPLALAPQGAALTGLLDWAAAPADPAALLAFLHALPAAFDLDPVVFASHRAALEVHWLRGPVQWRGATGLAAYIAGPARQARALDPQQHAARIAMLETACAGGRALFARLWQVLGPLLERGDRGGSGAHLCALVSGLEEITGASALWSGSAGPVLASVLANVQALIDVREEVPALEVAALVRRETLRAIVHQPGQGHPRLSIWGPLEARLQSRDRFVLAGLDEGIWPRKASIDGLLPPVLREKLGLPDPEERLGLSAHDFAQLTSGPEVILLRATRRGGAPTVASRWIWRLVTLARGAELTEWQAPECHRLIKLAKVLDRVGTVRGAPRPEPRPARTLRPTRYSPSLVATLQRDPYSVFARNILRLEPLGPAGEIPGPSGRGTAVHAALERFEIHHSHLSGGAALTCLTGLIAEALVEAGSDPDRVAIEVDLTETIARHWLEWRGERQGEVMRTEVERRIDQPLFADPSPFSATARIDRLEYFKDGSIGIFDYKTGDPPTLKNIECGLEPQMPLLAALVLQGGLTPGAIHADPTQHAISRLGLVAVKHTPKTVDIAPSNIPKLAASALQLARATALHYDDPDTPYLPRIASYKEGYAQAYDRLSRFEEWGVNDGEAEHD